MKTWNNVGFFVAAARSDGSAPSFEKALDGKVFLDYTDAEAFQKEKSDLVGYDYKIFIVELSIPTVRECRLE